MLRNVESMNYADIEKGLNALGEKVSCMFIKLPCKVLHVVKPFIK